MSLVRRCCACRLVMGIRVCDEWGVTDGYCPSCAADLIRDDPEAGGLVEKDFRESDLTQTPNHSKVKP